MPPKVIENWMIYGAYGYTAKLIAAEAVKRGHQPVLAGRDEAQLLDLSDQLGLAYRVFELDHPKKIKQALEGIDIVLHCAGPFVHTADIMREACIGSLTHYLDITGEADVLEQSYQTHARAQEAGVVVISGVGFDVVPTDFMAYALKQRLADATHLELAFAGDGGVSPGTAKTMVEMMPGLGKIRQAGEVKTVPLAYVGKELPFSDKPRYCMSIPWGDIVTAYYSTEIPNILVLTAIEESQAKWVKRCNHIVDLLAIKWVRKYLQKLIAKKVVGPSAEARAAGFMRLWGRAYNEQDSVEMFVDTPEGYSFTVISSLLFVEELLANKIMPGAYTPSQAVDSSKFFAMQSVIVSEPSET